MHNESRWGWFTVLICVVPHDLTAALTLNTRELSYMHTTTWSMLASAAFRTMAQSQRGSRNCRAFIVPRFLLLQE